MAPPTTQNYLIFGRSVSTPSFAFISSNYPTYNCFGALGATDATIPDIEFENNILILSKIHNTCDSGPSNTFAYNRQFVTATIIPSSTSIDFLTYQVPGYFLN